MWVCVCVGGGSDYTVCTLYIISVFYELVTKIYIPAYNVCVVGRVECV